MPLCPRCHSPYENSEPHCPQCGTPRPVFISPPPRPGSHRSRCSPPVHACLFLARIASFLAAIATLAVGVFELINGAFVSGLASIFIATPVAIGQFIGFGLLIQYAEEEPRQNNNERNS